jgi:hypothetical protein
MNESDIGVYATVDTVLSGVVPNEKLASQTRFSSGAGVRDRSMIPSQRKCAPDYPFCVAYYPEFDLRSSRVTSLTI